MLKETFKRFLGKKHILMLIFLTLYLIVSEVFLYIDNTIGFILYSILIAFFLISLSHIESLDDYGKLMIILMIVPILRVTGLFIILSEFWSIILTYCMLLFLAFHYSVRFKLDHGHKKEKLELAPLAVIIGVVLGFIGAFLFDLNLPSNFLYIIPLIAYSEEILFRGMIQNIIKKGYGLHFSILITSLLYGAFSVGYGYLFALFMVFAGIFIGIIYDKTKNIFLATAISIILHYFLIAPLQL